MNRGFWMAAAGEGRAHRRPEIVVVDEGSEMLQMEFLKNKFDLTPAEARLVVRLITGESLRPCANALGIKYETVRTYLKSVFQKTKTRRQAELVLVVIRAMNAANLEELDAPRASRGDKTTRAPLATTL
jgi:DNA-binding CsgD family transcriptional regulator